MFQEHPFQDRFRAAQQCGFTAVEILSPYQHTVEQLQLWLDDAGLRPVLININPGEPGETGTAAIPGRQDFFRESFNQAFDYAQALGVPMIHVLAGRETDQVLLSEELCIENLKWAADIAAQADISILLEPLNTQDVPGYLHTLNEQTAELIQKTDRNNLKLQFDFYHRQIMEGNLADGLRTHFDLIGHVQFSSVPGRHEPQYGEVNVPYLCDYLDELGYTGWIGCEYAARFDTAEGLSWAQQYGLGTDPGSQ